MNKTVKVITLITAAVCVGALIYFIFFFGNTAVPENELTTAQLTDYEITFDTPELEYYDGCDFLQGVKAQDENGIDLSEYVTVSCKPTKNLHKKVLTYSINKSGCKIKSFERTLTIPKSYTGPSVTSNGTTLEIPLNKLDSISAFAANQDIIITDDGFGNPCSFSISTPAIDGVGDYVSSVTATNILGDTASCKLAVSVVEADTSVIKLSASSVNISVGDSFSPEDYIVSCNHEDYGDLTPYVSISNNVDTSKSGVYTVEYSIKGIKELQNEKTYLYVTVN